MTARNILKRSSGGESAWNLGLFRHGPAEARSAARYPDDDLRPLTAKGRKRVLACGRGLRALKGAPGILYTSPALRARETADILARALKLPRSAVREEPALHGETDPRALLRRLPFPKAGERVLWVGHEPWLGEILGVLLGGKPLPLRKAGFAALAVPPSGPRPGKARLIAFLPPEALSIPG